MHWKWALFGGFLGATAVIGLLAWDRAKAWELRAAGVRQSLQAGGSSLQTTLMLRGDRLRADLTTEGRRLAENAARAEADRTLATVYGITQDRIRRINDLWTRWS
jgi:hypothetical protein